MGRVGPYPTFSPLPRRVSYTNRSRYRKRKRSHCMRNLLSPWNPLALGFHGIPNFGEDGAVSLCCTCPGVTPGRRCLLSLPCGARTFLIRGLSACVRGCPTWSRIYCTSPGGKSQIPLQILLRDVCRYFQDTKHIMDKPTFLAKGKKWVGSRGRTWYSNSI